ncbi:PEP-CTERM sorting domain-containing protein [Vasconcelosia minhoensis]|nr:PEP-CTERM sorting domain-containing protein [Romeria gracilis]
MKSLKYALPILLATLGNAVLPTAAQAFSFTPLTSFTDSDFQNEVSSGAFTELFVTESRIGNNANNGDRELGINTATGAPVAQGQYKWLSGTASDFLLQYDGSKVTYSVDGIALSSMAFTGDVSKIFIRTRGSGGNKPLGSVALTNLFFNGQAYTPGLTSNGTNSGADVDYLAITDITSPFTLTGKSTFTFGNATPSGSQLAYQFKVGTTPSEAVPEPATILGLAMVFGLGTGLKRKLAA